VKNRKNATSGHARFPADKRRRTDDPVTLSATVKEAVADVQIKNPQTPRVEIL